MHRAFAAFVLSLLSACATAQTPAAPAVSVAPTPAVQAAQAAGFDLSKLPLAKFAHADVLNAAAIASANGYDDRAAVWKAFDGQITACENAITASIPHLPTNTGTTGVATILEIGDEALGQIAIPTQVLVHCKSIALPVAGFVLPKF